MKMKVKSEEARVVLERYQPKTELDELAKEVLLANNQGTVLKDESVEKIIKDDFDLYLLYYRVGSIMEELNIELEA